jgi:hypothetical protein
MPASRSGKPDNDGRGVAGLSHPTTKILQKLPFLMVGAFEQ